MASQLDPTIRSATTVTAAGNDNSIDEAWGGPGPWLDPDDELILQGPGPVARWLRALGPWTLVVLGPPLLVAMHLNWLEVRLFRLGPVPLELLWRASVFAVLTVLICAARPLGRWVGAQANIAVGVTLAMGGALLVSAVHGWIGRPATHEQYLAAVMGVAIGGIGLWTQHLSWREGFAWIMRAVLCAAVLGFLIESLIPTRRVDPWFYCLPSFGLPIKPDQAAHFWGAAMLTLIALGAELGGRRWGALAVGIVPVLIVLAQVGMEYLQRLAGRDFQVEDLIAHAIGVGAATALYLLVRLFCRVVRRVRRDGAMGQPAAP